MGDGERIVSIRGEPIKSPYEPDEDAMEVARDMLQRVESGEVKGIIVCMAYSDGSFGHQTGGETQSYGMVGALEFAKRHLQQGYDPE